MRQHKLIYTSSYDRGLEHLLFMWSQIRAKYPDAELHIAYGWDLFDKIAHNNPERIEWQKNMKQLMLQDGVTDHGRISKDELHKLRKECGIWAYPTHFTEINCISALEAQADGCVPLTVALAALKETVGSGVMVEGDIHEPEIRDKYLEELLNMMGDEKRWKDESNRAREFARNYSWEKIAKEWTKEFGRDDQSIKLSVYTPTVRKGWWDLMARNLSEQTYKNFEWIIVDDMEEDRSKLAERIAKQYKLDVKYMKGKERTKKRTYGLVNANNTALQAATGDLMVFLQDFILIPQDGLEQLAFLHRKNPNALLAPCDMYVAPKVKPDIESEDWFHGETDVIGDFIRQNIRIRNEGMRFSDHPFDFEQNYGAIPVKIARELGGWYEFYDFGLGYDNCEMAYRALLKGYRILLDETNVAVCIDHWEALKGKRENVLGRARKLNDPLFLWMREMIQKGKVPVIRKEDIDNKIDLQYEIPEEISDDKVVEWIREFSPAIVQKWINEYEKKL